MSKMEKASWFVVALGFATCLVSLGIAMVLAAAAQ